MQRPVHSSFCWRMGEILETNGSLLMASQQLNEYFTDKEIEPLCEGLKGNKTL